MTTELQEFGNLIRQRRERLGYVQLDLKARGGPSNTTLTKIENGELPPPSRSTLRKLDLALGWKVGTATELLNARRTESGEIYQEWVNWLLTKTDDPDEPRRPESHVGPEPGWKADADNTSAVERLRLARDQLDLAIQQLEGAHDGQATEPQQGQGRTTGGSEGGTIGGRGTSIAKSSAERTEWDAAIQGIRDNPQISEGDKLTTIEAIETLRVDALKAEGGTMAEPGTGAGA